MVWLSTSHKVGFKGSFKRLLCTTVPACVWWDSSICHCQPGEGRLVHVKLLKLMLCVTELANLTMNIAEKLKMWMLAAIHWCLHNLVAVGAYRSREVRELYQSFCCHPCSFSRALLVSAQLGAVYLERKKLFLLGSADELWCGMVDRVMYLCVHGRKAGDGVCYAFCNFWPEGCLDNS